MGPINYLGAAPQTDFLRNIQGGLQIGQMFRQGQREEAAFAAQQQQLQAQQAAQAAYQADVSAAMANPTPAGIRALALKYPQHGKVYTELLSGLSGEQRTAALGDTASLAAALSGGRTDVASRLVDQRIEAMRTRGEQTADVEALRDAIKTNPQAAYGHALSLLAGFGEDGAKVLDTLSKARSKPQTKLSQGEAVYDEAGNRLFGNDKPEELTTNQREYAQAVKEGFKGSLQEWIEGQKRAGATSITLPKIELKTGESIAGQIGPMLREGRDQARAGLKLVESAGRVLDAAEKGQIFAGPTANLRFKTAQAVTALGDALGIEGGTTAKKIANTRAVIRGMAEQAVAARSQLGGQAQISNSEQELLNRATAGDIGDLTMGEILQIAQTNDSLGRQIYGLHEATMSQVRARPDLKALGDFYEVPPLPPARAKASTPAAAISPGTVERGYRFKGGNPADKANWERVK